MPQRHCALLLIRRRQLPHHRPLLRQRLSGQKGLLKEERSSIELIHWVNKLVPRDRS